MNKQASSRFCFVCGVENEHGLKVNFYNQEPGVIMAKCLICDKHQGYPGIVHGGVIAAILDEVAGRSFMEGDPRKFMVTAKLSVRYRRPVPVGQPLIAIGRAIEDNGRIAKATGQLLGPDGTLLADAEVILVQIPTDLAENMRGAVEDWRVYPDSEVKP